MFATLRFGLRCGPRSFYFPRNSTSHPSFAKATGSGCHYGRNSTRDDSLDNCFVIMSSISMAFEFRSQYLDAHKVIQIILPYICHIPILNLPPDSVSIYQLDSFIVQPVLKCVSMGNTGKGCASVLNTILSSGKISFGPNNRYRYFNVSAYRTTSEST